MIQPSVFSHHTFSEGERVHYRPLDEVKAALEEGYLELEVGGEHWILCKIGQEYQFSEAQIGYRRHTVSQEPTLEVLLERENLDPHAFRWYPYRRVRREDEWLLDATQNETRLLKERIDFLLGEPLSETFLVDTPVASN